MDELHRDELLSHAIVSELAMFLRTSGSTLCLSEAVTRAVKFWIAAQQEAAAPPRGYQWKSLFLPSGTRVRMHFLGECYYADVIDEDLVFRGRATSPRQMTVAIDGAGHNAWRDLWIRRPHESDWTQADKLRRAALAHAGDKPPSPTEAIQAAAKCMSETLQSALLLVDQSRLRAEQQVDRRVPKQRRREDQLESDWLAD
ncbi:MAG TPA: hypothetical protein VGF27_07945 [Pseudoduganella sp.]